MGGSDDGMGNVMLLEDGVAMWLVVVGLASVAGGGRLAYGEAWGVS